MVHNKHLERGSAMVYLAVGITLFLAAWGIFYLIFGTIRSHREENKRLNAERIAASRPKPTPKIIRGPHSHTISF